MAKKTCAPPPVFATLAIPIHQQSAAVKPQRTTKDVRFAGRVPLSCFLCGWLACVALGLRAGLTCLAFCRPRREASKTVPMVARKGTVRKTCAPPPVFATPAIPIHQNSAAVNPLRMISVARVFPRGGFNGSRLLLTVTPL